MARFSLAFGSQAKKAERLYAERLVKFAPWKRSRKPDDAATAYRFFRFVPKGLKVLDERECGYARFVSATVK